MQTYKHKAKALVPLKKVATYEVGEDGHVLRLHIVQSEYSLPHGRPHYSLRLWRGWTWIYDVDCPTFEAAERLAARILAEVALRGEVPSKSDVLRNIL